MIRRGLPALLVLLLPFATPLPAQEDAIVALPRPKPHAAAPDEEAQTALAKRLCEAIDKGDLDAVRKALDDGASPDKGMGAGEDSTKGRTPLIHAVVAKRPELIELLIARGAFLDIGDDAGHTPLHYAVLTHDLDLARLLHRLGARLDRKDSADHDPYAYAPEGSDIEKWTVDAGKHDRALCEALSEGDLDAARKAVEAGASPNAHDDEHALLLAAVRRDDVALCSELMGNGCRVDLVVGNGFSPTTPLAYAAEWGEFAVLQQLLKDSKPSSYALGLALASASASRLPDRAARVRLLLAAGADPCFDRSLQTPPLPAAAALGDFDTLKILLEAGADQRSVDHALLAACGIEDEAQSLAVVRALLAIGADADFDHFFATALGGAATKGHLRVLEAMLPQVHKDETVGAAVGESAREGGADGLRWLCEHAKARIDFAYRAGVFDPPLQAAIVSGHLDCLEVMLAAGAAADQEPPADGDPPLIAAVRRQDHRAIEILLKAGADPAKEWNSFFLGKRSAISLAQELEDAEALALLKAALPGAADDPLGATLHTTALKFDDVGAFHRLRYTHSEAKRAQYVYMRKSVDTYGELRTQEIFSLCYDEKDPPSNELMQTLLLKRWAIGGLVLEKPGETQTNWRIRFRVAAPCDLSAERLARYLLLVESTADSLEHEIHPDAEDRL
ncbi:MAG: ankyrin repeat domain-containing protein [Planctomycetota bacterium]